MQTTRRSPVPSGSFHHSRGCGFLHPRLRSGTTRRSRQEDGTPAPTRTDSRINPRRRAGSVLRFRVRRMVARRSPAARPGTATEREIRFMDRLMWIGPGTPRHPLARHAPPLGSPIPPNSGRNTPRRDPDQLAPRLGGSSRIRGDTPAPLGQGGRCRQDLRGGLGGRLHRPGSPIKVVGCRGPALIVRAIPEAIIRRDPQ